MISTKNPLDGRSFCRPSGILLCLALVSCAQSPGLAAPSEVPTNERTAECPAQAPKPILGEMPSLSQREPYKILVGGHLYGAPGKLRTRPSISLRNHLERLAGSADFFVSLGDFVMTFAQPVIDPTLADLRQLEMPIFNAVGNHDYTTPALYELVCAPTYGCFVYGADLVVILNTEQTPWQIRGDQLAMLKQALHFAASAPDLHNVFIFGHRLVFACDQPRYAGLFEHHNDKPRYDGSANFRVDVLPLLTEVAAVKRVYWFAGDLGAAWTGSLFCDTDPETKVTYVATGLGDRPEDCLVQISVDAAGAVSLTTISLGSKQLGPPQDYGIEAWNEKYPPK